MDGQPCLCLQFRSPFAGANHETREADPTLVVQTSPTSQVMAPEAANPDQKDNGQSRRTLMFRQPDPPSIRRPWQAARGGHGS